MSYLGNLSQDIFEIVFSYLNDSRPVFNLWKCGNIRLNLLLENGGCRLIRIYDRKHHIFDTPPKMLCYLRQLRSLSLIWEGDVLIGAHNLAQLLQSLSSTLEELEIECIDAQACFLLSPPPSEFYMSTRHLERRNSKPSNWKNVSTPNSTRLWDVAGKFPNLYRLNLNSSFPLLLPDDMAHLPPKLVELSLISATSALTCQLGALPRQLTSFSTNRIDCELAENLRDLPPNLTVLKLNEELEWSIEMAQALPRSIQRIKALTVGWDVNLLGALPPALENLRFVDKPSVDSFSFAVCPIHLTKLDLAWTIYSRSQILTLPRTLTCLRCSTLDWSRITSKTDLPPRLAKIGVSESLSYLFPSTVVQHLPDTLKSLRAAFERPMNYLSLLPAGLTRLRSMQPDWEKVPCLPSQLRECDFGLMFWTSDYDVQSPSLPSTLTTLRLRDWKNPDFSILPLVLQHLSISRGYVPSVSFRLIPVGLKKLEIGQVYEIIDKEILSSLPPTLENLNVWCFLGSTEEDLLSALPRTLEALKIGGRFSSNVSPSQFQFLPPNLSKFHCNCTFIADCHLNDLPKSLLYLEVVAENYGLSRGAVFPANLRRYQVSGVHGGYSSDAFQTRYNRI